MENMIQDPTKLPTCTGHLATIQGQAGYRIKVNPRPFHPINMLPVICLAVEAGHDPVAERGAKGEETCLQSDKKIKVRH